MKFQDETGKSWDLTLSVGITRKIKRLFDYDISDLTEETILAALVDQNEFASLLWTILEDQITKENMTEDDFALRLTAPVLETAGEAFLRAIANFSNPIQRKSVLTLIDRIFEKTTKAADQLEEVAKTMDLPDPDFGNGSTEQAQSSDIQ